MPDIARAYLERLQRQQAASGRFPPRYFDRSPLDEDQLRAIIGSTLPESLPDRSRVIDEGLRDMRARDAEMAALLPTPLQSVMTYSLIMDLYDQIDLAAQHLAISSQTVPRPVLGTLASGQVNGMAARPLGSSTYVVLLEDGLFIFCHLMAKALAHGFPIRPGEQLTFSTAPEDWDFGAHSTASIRMREALHAYAVLGDATLAPQYFASPGAGVLSGVFREGAELFVIGHEWAHIHRGHLEIDDAADFAMPAVSVNRILTNHEQEFEADYFGAVLAIQAQLMRPYDLALSYVGPRIFLVFLELLEEMLSLLRWGEVREGFPSDTHPTTRSRIAAMDHVIPTGLERSFPQEQITNAAGFSTQIGDVILELRGHLHNAFKELHREGVRPHAIWG